jgi:predicted short-subunit dehydrogenase-like oxidoreductase (DUF2520 family)
MSIFNVAIIGVGKLGGALALALSGRGYKVQQLGVRRCESANTVADLISPRPQILRPNELDQIDTDVVFIAVQDSEIPTLVESLAAQLEHLPFIFHTSGALSSKILRRLNDEGCEVASFHPLISVSDSISGARNFKDAYFAIEGDSAAVAVARLIANDLGGKSFSPATNQKALYHAAAVTACGHLVALISAAVEMLTDCGLEPKTAQEILLPLIKSTVSNLETQTPAEALTGTFARADVETLDLHLTALHENFSEELLKIYLQLGLRSLKLAKENGADPSKLEKMREMLEKDWSQEEIFRLPK